MPSKILINNLFLYRFKGIILKFHTFFQYPDSLTQISNWWSDHTRWPSKGTGEACFLLSYTLGVLHSWNDLNRFHHLEITKQQATSKWTARERGDTGNTSNSAGRDPILSEEQVFNKSTSRARKESANAKAHRTEVNGNCVRFRGIIYLPSCDEAAHHKWKSSLYSQGRMMTTMITIGNSDHSNCWALIGTRQFSKSLFFLQHACKSGVKIPTLQVRLFRLNSSAIYLGAVLVISPKATGLQSLCHIPYQSD